MPDTIGLFYSRTAMTLREIVQLKLDAAKFEVGKLEDELTTLEAKTATLFDSDVEAIKEWFESVKVHLGL
jgi:hypothetical protein